LFENVDERRFFKLIHSFLQSWQAHYKLRIVDGRGKFIVICLFNIHEIRIPAEFLLQNLKDWIAWGIIAYLLLFIVALLKSYVELYGIRRDLNRW
jgi:hypothetical protein